MNCSAARRLLEQGVQPGSSPPERATLGFHLASCADCRAYRANLDHQLLSSLLAADQTRALSAGPALLEPATDGTVAGRTWRESLSQLLGDPVVISPEV